MHLPARWSPRRWSHSRWSTAAACGLAALALTAMPAAAEEAPPPPPVVNGTPTGDYEYVGMLVACYNGNYCQDWCSGSLVKSDWVVTAAHCVEAIDDFARSGYNEFYVVFGRSLSDYDDYAVIDRWIEHPSYSSSSLQADIGLLELDSNVTSISPVAVNTDSPSSFRSGTDFTYVGFGITDDGANDSGTKRVADIPYYDYDSQFIYAYDSTGTHNVCSGDSGGAGLNSLGGGSYELVAVNSFVASVDGRTGPCEGGYTGGTRADAFYSWMDGYVNFSSSGGSTGGSSGSGSGSDDGGSSGSGGSGSSGSGGSGSGGSGSGGSGSGGSGSGGDDGGGDVGGDDGSWDTGDPSEDANSETAPEWGETEAEPGEAPGKAAGCSTAASAAAPAAMLAWLGAMAVARRREDG